MPTNLVHCQGLKLWDILWVTLALSKDEAYKNFIFVNKLKSPNVA